MPTKGTRHVDDLPNLPDLYCHLKRKLPAGHPVLELLLGADKPVPNWGEEERRVRAALAELPPDIYRAAINANRVQRLRDNRRTDLWADSKDVTPGDLRRLEYLADRQGVAPRELFWRALEAPPPATVTGNAPEPPAPESVTSNTSPEAAAAAEEIVKAYYQQSKAKDPKTVLERALRAVVETEVLPKIAEAVQNRFAKEREELNARSKRLVEMRAETEATWEEARRLRDNLPGLMTQDEYRALRGCLHPDRVPEDRKETYAKAFNLVTRLGSAVQGMSAKARRAKGWA